MLLYLFVCLSIQVKIKGFNQKQSVLLNSIVRKLVDFVVDDKKFAVYKELVSCNIIVMASKGCF